MLAIFSGTGGRFRPVGGVKCDRDVTTDMLEKTREKETIKKEFHELFARQSVGYLVKRVVAVMSKRLNESLADFDITLSQWVVLSCLWQKDGLPVMYIAGQLQHIGGTLSDLLTRMEKKKLLKRKRDKNDKRIWRVFLTDEGKALSSGVPALVHRLWYHAWQGLSEDDLGRFSRILDQMIHNFDPEYSVCLPEGCSEVPARYHFVLPPRSPGYRLKVLQLLTTRRFADSIEVHNVTPSHWVVLCRLWQEDGVPVSEIGQYLEQIGGSLAGVLERMEERSLIRRQKDERDRRSFRVWLTADGENLIHVLPQLAHAVLEEQRAGISDADVGFFKESLNGMLAIIQPPTQS
jgi:DNA-binding MarR family transcriptional regulator